MPRVTVYPFDHIAFAPFTERFFFMLKEMDPRITSEVLAIVSYLMRQQVPKELPVILLKMRMYAYEVIENLKVDIYMRNKTRKTALMSQILDKRNKRKLEILFVNGADMNAQDIHGNTVLHYAAWIDCDIDIVKLLKEYGAGPVQDKLGQFPCQIAQKRGHALLAQELCPCHNKEHLKEVTFHNECVYFCTEGLTCLPDSNSIQKRLKYFQRDSISDLLTVTGIGKVIFDGEAGEIKSAINEIVTNICEDIGHTDRMFYNEVFPSGSVSEETKVGLPDEFDFICRLDKLSTMCEIEESDNPYQSSVSVSIKQEFGAELEDFQDENHYIKAECVCRIFVDNVERAVKKLNLYEYPNITLVREEYSINPNCKLTFQWSGCEYKNIEINVDIVPALQIPGWWPSKADLDNLPFDTTQVQQDGALLLFHLEDDDACPEGFNAVILPSAATAERAYMKQLPQLARDVYMVSKILCNERISPRVLLSKYEPILHETSVTENVMTSYILKIVYFMFFLITETIEELLVNYRYVSTTTCTKYLKSCTKTLKQISHLSSLTKTFYFPSMTTIVLPMRLRCITRSIIQSSYYFFCANQTAGYQKSKTLECKYTNISRNHAFSHALPLDMSVVFVSTWSNSIDFFNVKTYNVILD
ncbi:uncharacterized protein LOC128556536 [Mercenaria mercenaria]|uniref:uncharacterized protein LOC128556536 n=1 Tax=Mercenaria mercenaria TaxID=6596 RepID=UPI00234E88B3|nr:uncharacterized protein LOC128556536 [Mercenaria mercenaria]